MILKLNWPSAAVFIVAMIVIGALIGTGHHLPAAIVGLITTMLSSALPAIVRTVVADGGLEITASAITLPAPPVGAVGIAVAPAESVNPPTEKNA